MTEPQYAKHEVMELHELLVFKNVCMTKSMTMQALVGDGALNDLLQSCAAMDRRHVDQLQAVLSKAVATVTDEGMRQ